MKILDTLHGRYVTGRRARRLSRLIAEVLPRGASVLDVGCGDGKIARLVMDARPDVALEGIDVMLRPRSVIPVGLYDGRVIPHSDRSFDVVMFVDVLHHTDNPVGLLLEAARVARTAVVVKDHAAEGLFAYPTLRFMDRLGNCRHNVAMPYNYLTLGQWWEAFDRLGLVAAHWTHRLNLYPFPADLIFGRRLHFLSRLEPDPARPTVNGGRARSRPLRSSAIAHQSPAVGRPSSQ